MANKYLKAFATFIGVLCFAPLAVLLLFGLMFLPNWIVMLSQMLTDSRYKPSAEGEIWVVVLPILLVVAGFLGMIGLIRMVMATGQNSTSKNQRAKTLLLCATGLGAIALLLWYTSFSFSIEYLSANILSLFIYLIFPVVGAIALLFLSYQALFKNSESDGG